MEEQRGALGLALQAAEVGGFTLRVRPEPRSWLTSLSRASSASLPGFAGRGTVAPPLRPRPEFGSLLRDATARHRAWAQRFGLGD